MNPTTLPRPTRQPHEYAADAIADHYRRHGADRTATAALELAVILADVVDPAQLNTIADRLDLLSFGAGDAARLARGRTTRPADDPDAHALIAGAAAEIEAAIAGERVAGVHVAGERGPRADLVIVNDPLDDRPAPTIAAGRYRITFDAGTRGEARIGRTYNVPPVELTVADDDAEAIGDAVYRVARPLLLSGDTDVHVNPGPTPSAGRVVILAGYQTAGTGTYQRIGDS